MISSIPQPITAPTERALYQAMCDLSEIAAAGWEVRITPTHHEYQLAITFAPVPGTASALEPLRALLLSDPENGPAETVLYGYRVSRFALPSDVLRVMRDFHRRVIPRPSPDETQD